MNIKPIRNKKDYEKTLNRIEKILHSEKDIEELELLSILVEKYEEEHFSIPESDPISIIKLIMDLNNLKQKDLEDVIGSKSHVSDILNKRRHLTLPMIRNFSKKYHVPIELLSKEYSIKNNNSNENRCSYKLAAAKR